MYKQLDDFRARKRSWGAMNAIAQALSAQDSADVGAYFASRSNGLPPFVGERFQAGHTLREDNPAIRLVFAGDPARGIPPSSASSRRSPKAFGRMISTNRCALSRPN
jgi:hypothetical protein